MHQLIGIALVIALLLAVMPAPGGAAADDGHRLYPAAVAVPNFLSYRDRSRVADAPNPSARNHPSRPANTAEFADGDDRTDVLGPDPAGVGYDIGAYEY